MYRNMIVTDDTASERRREVSTAAVNEGIQMTANKKIKETI